MAPAAVRSILLLWSEVFFFEWPQAARLSANAIMINLFMSLTISFLQCNINKWLLHQCYNIITILLQYFG